MENFKYILKTNTGRIINNHDNKTVKCIDNKLFVEVDVPIEECFGRYVSVNKPIPLINEKKYSSGLKLNFNLGQLIGITIGGCSRRNFYNEKYMIYFKDLKLREWFMRHAYKRFSDFNYEESNPINFVFVFNSKHTAIIIKSKKFHNLISSLNIDLKNKFCPNEIERMPIEFRKGLILGILDAGAQFEYHYDKNKIRHIRVVMKYLPENMANDLFTLTDSVDMIFYLKNYYGDIRIVLASSELKKNRLLFKKFRSSKARKFISRIRNEHIKERTRMVPITKDIAVTFKLYKIYRNRNTINRTNSIYILNKKNINNLNQRELNWKNMVLAPNTSYEKLIKPIKVAIK